MVMCNGRKAGLGDEVGKGDAQRDVQRIVRQFSATSRSMFELARKLVEGAFQEIAEGEDASCHFGTSRPHAEDTMVDPLNVGCPK